MAIMGTLESTTLDETIRCASKCFIFSIEKQNQKQVCNLRATHSSIPK